MSEKEEKQVIGQVATQASQANDTITLLEAIMILWGKKFTLLMFVLFGAAIGFAISNWLRPQFTSDVLLQIDVKGNKVDGYDTAAYKYKIPWLTPIGAPTTNVAYAWKDGSVDIDNPFGWHVKGTRGNTPPHKVFGEHIQDTIMLDRQGRVGVWKQDNRMERSTNDVVWLCGPRAQEEE